MFLNLLLAHRFFGMWCLVLTFVLIGRQAQAGPAPHDNRSWSPFLTQVLLVAAGWAWAVVLARSLPPWRVTMSWAGEGMVLFDSRAPLWAALGLWGVFRSQPAVSAELAPYALAAALIADPGAVSGNWLAGGFQQFTAGEGLPNLLVLALPLVAFWSGPSGSGGSPAAKPGLGGEATTGPAGGDRGRETEGPTRFPGEPGSEAHPEPAGAGEEAGGNGVVGCALVAGCFWGIAPSLAVLWAALHLPGPERASWRRDGGQALIVAALLEWLETSTIGVGSAAGAVTAAALFTLVRILPSGRTLGF